MSIQAELSKNAIHDEKLDTFAAAALQGLLAAKHPDVVSGNGYRPDRASEIAYDFAKAMVAERTKHIRNKTDRAVIRTASTGRM